MSKILICFLLLFSYLTSAANLDNSYLPDPNYLTYTTENGLSNNIVYSIEQDNDGYMWFGTEDGLNRFDGNEFKIYRHDPSNPKSLAGLQIQSLTVDSKGNLWIGTLSGGISLYDRKNDQFINFSLKQGLTHFNIQEVVEIDNVLWVSTDLGINLIDINTKEVSQIDFDENDKTKTNHKWIREIVNDGNFIWIGTWGGGLNRYNKLTKRFDYFKHDPNDETTISSDIIHKVYKDLQGSIWVGTLENGLNRFIKECNCFKQYVYENSNNKGIPSDFIMGFVEDAKSNLWVLTKNGAAVYQSSDDHFNTYQLLHGHELGSGSRELMSGFVSRDKTLWLGSDDMGIIAINNNGFNFKTYSYSPDRINFLESSNVTSLLIDDNNFIWTGTSDAIYRYPISKNGTLGKAVKVLDVTAYKIIKAKDHSFWIAAQSGLYQLSPERKLIAYYDHQQLMPHALTKGKVFDVIESKNGDLYIASERGGLARFDTTLKKFEFINLESFEERALHPHDLNALYEDKVGDIWIGYRKGVYKYSPQSKKIREYELRDDLSQPQVAAYFINGLKSGIYIGTDRGIYRYQSKSDKFIKFPFQLKSSYVQSITEDENDNLWFTTFDGLYKWNISAKKLSQFTEANGLQGNSFNAKAVYKNNNLILFGGKNGISSIEPNKFDDNIVQGKVFWDNLMISGGSTSKSINLLSKSSIEISHEINVMTFHYFNDDYESPNQHEYRYRLNGGNWQANNNLRVIKFFNLNKGKYQLDLQVKKPNSDWHDAKSPLSFTILPPLWQTKTAYLSYLFIILSILFIGYKIRISRIKQHQKELENRVIERTSEVNNLLTQKQNLFANISHELRTPLTLISAPLEQLIEDNSFSSKQNKLIQMANNNSKRLFNLVEKILKLTSVDKQDKNIEYIVIDDQLVKYIIAFEPLLQAKNIKLLKTVKSNTVVYADKDDLSSVIENLFSNALKYTLDNGWVKLNSSITDNQYQLIIENSHQGLSETETEKVFERFERLGQSDSELGFGLGLAFVKEICQQNGWQIRCVSNKGNSVSFILTIDKFSILEQQASTPAQRQINQLAIGKNSKIKNSVQSILIVEDNNELRDFLAEIFSTEYKVTTAKNGSLGITTAIEEIPDIVISDVMMPELDGYQLVQHLARHDNTCHIPVILLTAKADKESELKGLELGSVDYITKPFDAKELLLKIKNTLARRKSLLNMIHGSGEQNNTQYISERDKHFNEKLNKIVEKNYSDSGFGVEQLVDKIAMSERQLQRKLKAVFNQTPAEFIRYYRLQKSKELLLAGKSISNVADLVGFNSSSYFSRSFKSTFNQSPSEFIQDKVTA